MKHKLVNPAGGSTGSSGFQTRFVGGHTLCRICNALPPVLSRTVGMHLFFGQRPSVEMHSYYSSMLPPGVPPIKEWELKYHLEHVRSLDQTQNDSSEQTLVLKDTKGITAVDAFEFVTGSEFLGE